MIDLYSGDFLISPIPLELSGNRCSHKCAYCFADKERDSEPEAVTRQLAEFSKRKSLVARLMQAHCPVLVSNKSDPFAGSNYQQTVPWLRMMTELGIPFAIQTKGGKGIDDVLEFAPPSVWYVSISFEDDALRKTIEPGTPSTEERVELISRLRDRHHRVVVACNPLVREWLPEVGRLLERCKGIEGLWISPLHLNSKQVFGMSPHQRQAIGEPVLKRAKQRRATADELAHDAEARTAAAQLGIEVFTGGQWQPSDFWRPYQETYATLYPVIQDWVNQCHAILETGDTIELSDFLDFMVPDLPAGEWNLREYVYVNCKGSRYDNLAYKADVKRLTFRQLLTVGWHEPSLMFSPSQIKCFAYAVQNGKQLRDDTGAPVMVYTSEPTEEFFLELAA